MFSLKRTFALLTSIFLTASSAGSVQAAGSFSYALPTDKHTGLFQGQTALVRLGNLRLPQGLASFSEDEIIIRAVPPWLFDRNIVLKGVIVRAEGLQQENGFVLGGLALMLQGLWLKDLDRTSAPESIDTLDGTTFRGRITGQNGESFTFQQNNGKTENIPFARIKTINSARAFTFNISTDNVKINPQDSSLSFTARELVMKSCNSRHVLLTASHEPASRLAGTEEGISRTALATFVGLDIMSTIAAPVAIPLVLNARNQRAAKNKISTVDFQNFAQTLQSSASGRSASGL